MPPDRLPTRVFDLLKGSADKAPGLRVRQHTAQLFEVQRLSDQRAFRVVNLADRTCTCGFPSEYGVPCRHMCAAVFSVNGDFKQFVASERRREALVATYVGSIRPVDLSLLRNDGMQPPTVTKRRGRPKEKRIPSAAELRFKRTVTCGRCGARGHNSRSCKVQTD